jgi:tRNA-(ms[2]io[6]A)-hydroxylase
MRRLPVIQQSAVEDEDAAARPRWQWCLIGAGLTATIWIPLAAVAAPVGAAVAAHSAGARAGVAGAGRSASTPHEAAALAVMSALPLIVCFGIAAAAAGALIGRFGGRAGRREAGISGAIAAFLVTSVAALGGSGLSMLGIGGASLALAAVGAGAGFVGGGFGFRRRSVLGSPR